MAEQDKSLTDDVKSRLDDFQGRIREAAGALFDDEDMKREGQIDQLASDIRERGVEALDEVINEAKKRAQQLVGSDSDADERS